MDGQGIPKDSLACKYAFMVIEQVTVSPFETGDKR